MPMFIYEGQGHSLRIGGKTLLRGIPMDLEGTAAEAAEAFIAKRPGLRAIGDAKPEKASKPVASGSAAALAERQALVARAKELGIPAKGKNAELAAAIAAAEGQA